MVIDASETAVLEFNSRDGASIRRRHAISPSPRMLLPSWAQKKKKIFGEVTQEGGLVQINCFEEEIGLPYF